MPEMLIGGEWRKPPPTRSELEVVNPATEESRRQRACRLAAKTSSWQWRPPSARSPSGPGPTSRSAPGSSRGNAADSYEQR